MEKVSPEQILALKNSGGFDAEWYAAEYPDVKETGLDPAEHFLWLGAKLGRSPLPPAGKASAAADEAGNAPQPTGAAAGGRKLMTLADRGIPRPVFDLDAERSNNFDIKDDRFWSIVPKVVDFTELSIPALFNLYSAIRYIVDSNVPGDLIECGVHMGGSIMLIEHVLLEDRCDRRLFALDTFTGFVDRSEELDLDLATGAVACTVEENADFSAPSIENMESVGYDGLHIVKGDVLKTIPTLDIEKLALLRLDTDTYETTKFELEQLYERVVPGGVVIVDDYGYTVGCKKAVDDFIVGKKVMLQRINPVVRSWIKVGD